MYYKPYLKYLIPASICSSLLLLSGCVPEKKSMESVNKDVDQYQKDMKDAYDKVGNAYNALGQKQPQFQVSDQYYVMPSKRQPLWLQNPIVINGSFTVGELMKRMLHDVQGAVSFDGGAEASKVVNLHFSGTANEALPLIADKANYSVKVDGNNIVVTDITTETFQVHSIPGQADYNVGKANEQQAIGSIQSDISSGSGSGGSDNQFSNESASVNPWNDIRSSMKSLLSPTGTFQTSESTSTLTVTDHTQNLKRIEKWMKGYNANLSMQVSFKVQLISVELNDEYQRGIDWNAVFGSVAFGNGGSTVPNLPGTGAGASAFSFKYTDKNHSQNDNHLLITALSQEGKIANKDEPILTTINNHMAQLREVQTQAYLQQITSNVSSGSDPSTSNTMTPGSVTTGLELYLIPHIENDKVYLKLSVALGSLDKMGSISSSGGSGDTGGGSSSDKKSSPTVIQLPTVSVRRFNQDAILTDGETLVIGGFKMNQNAYANAKQLGISALGGFASSKANTELVLLITPYVSKR